VPSDRLDGTNLSVTPDQATSAPLVPLICHPDRQSSLAGQLSAADLEAA
jgi:hypothetical protein